MNYDFLVDAELDRIDWSKIQTASGMAEGVPTAFRQLITARNAEEVEKAYWQLENRVVVQGHLFQSSIHLVPAICAALAAPRSLLVRTWILELLFQICDGYYRETAESNASPPDIVARCRAEARNALWVLYAELAKQEVRIVEELLRLLDTDPNRLQRVISRIPNYKAPLWTVDS